MADRLEPRATQGAVVRYDPAGISRLEIPSGPGGTYRLAQLDDYTGLPRRRFLWRPPFQMTLSARVSAADIAGTWGFGLWNNPFSVRLGIELAGLFPAMPSAAWFFASSNENYLSFRSDKPAQGFVAQTFRAAHHPVWRFFLLALQAPFVPFNKSIARRFRNRLAKEWIGEDSHRIAIDPTRWHHYRLDWTTDGVDFYLDGEPVFTTPVSPPAPLGVVIWVDNQFAAFTPAGRISFGTLPNSSPAALELRDIHLEQR